MTTQLPDNVRAAINRGYVGNDANQIECVVFSHADWQTIRDYLVRQEANAARYVWLRENSYVELRCDSPQAEDWNPERLDADIDAMLAAAEEE
jgi:hypothetical protein